MTVTFASGVTLYLATTSAAATATAINPATDTASNKWLPAAAGLETFFVGSLSESGSLACASPMASGLEALA